MGAANQRLSGNKIRLKLNQEPWVAMVSGTDRVYKLRLNFLDPDRTKDGVGEWMLDDGFYCYSESEAARRDTSESQTVTSRKSTRQMSSR